MIKVSYATMEAMGMLVKRLGQDARRLEKRIADDLKAERDAEREALGIQAAKEAGKALGMVEGEGLRGAAKRVVKERDALRADVSDLRTLCDQWKQRETELLAEIERLKKTARKHPVAVGEWVLRTGGGGAYPIGTVAQVNQYSPSGDYLVRLAGQTRIVTWFKENCTPCDPPEATHDTPAGKETAQAAAEPKPGDVVRLVRVPTNDEYPHDSGRWEPNWGGIGDYMRVHHIGNNINGTRIVRAAFGLEWPISCIEIVEDAK